METKVCRRCEIEQTINQFWTAGLHPKRLTAKCKSCREETKGNRGLIHRRPSGLDESYIYCYPGKHWVQKDIEIWKNKAQKRGYAAACKSCDATGARERGRKYDITLREWVASFKDSTCPDCGNDWAPHILDWHHRVPEDKLFAISQFSKFTKDKVIIEAEIAKCDLLCANCHRDREFSTGRMGCNQYSK